MGPDGRGWDRGRWEIKRPRCGLSDDRESFLELETDRARTEFGTLRGLAPCLDDGIGTSRQGRGDGPTDVGGLDLDQSLDHHARVSQSALTRLEGTDLGPVEEFL